jgi:hypothetical protein
MPIALVTLVDIQKQYFISKVGLALEEILRNDAFCAYTVLSSSTVFVVPDATQDERFMHIPLVTGHNHLRFYAGAAICVDGMKIGSLCVMDTKPHHNFRTTHKTILQEITASISDIITIRRERNLEIQRTCATLSASLMRYVLYPLKIVTNEAIKLEQKIRQTMQSNSQDFSIILEDKIPHFHVSLHFLDDAVRSGVKLNLFLLQQERSLRSSKEDFLYSLQHSKVPECISLSTELESMFFEVSKSVHFDSASFSGNVLSYLWNSIDKYEDDNHFDHKSVDLMSKSDSRTMLDILQSRLSSSSSSSNLTTGLFSPAQCKDVFVDSGLLWASLYAVMSSQQPYWYRIQLSSGIAQNDQKVGDMATTLLRFTFHEYKEHTSPVMPATSMIEYDLGLLQTVLRTIGGNVRCCENLPPYTRIIEVSFPGVVILTDSVQSLSSTSREVCTVHTTSYSSLRHSDRCVLTSSRSSMSLYPCVHLPESEMVSKPVKRNASILSSLLEINTVEAVETYSAKHCDDDYGHFVDHDCQHDCISRCDAFTPTIDPLESHRLLHQDYDIMDEIIGSNTVGSVRSLGESIGSNAPTVIGVASNIVSRVRAIFQPTPKVYPIV